LDKFISNILDTYSLLFGNINEIFSAFKTEEIIVYLENFVILIIGLFIAKLVFLAIMGSLRLIKFDALAENFGLIDFFNLHIKEPPSRIIARIFYWIIITVMLCIMIDKLGFVDVSRLKVTTIRLFSQIISFASFIVVNFYILLFFAKIFSIALAAINFKYYLEFEKLVFIGGLIGIIYLALPILNINETDFVDALYFLMKGLTIGAIIILVFGLKDVVYSIFIYWRLKNTYPLGANIEFENKRYVISKIEFFSVTLLCSEHEISFDTIKFYNSIVKKR